MTFLTRLLSAFIARRSAGLSSAAVLQADRLSERLAGLMDALRRRDHGEACTLLQSALR